jgi:hypothetical protein
MTVQVLDQILGFWTGQQDLLMTTSPASWLAGQDDSLPNEPGEEMKLHILIGVGVHLADEASSLLLDCQRMPLLRQPSLLGSHGGQIPFT